MGGVLVRWSRRREIPVRPRAYCNACCHFCAAAVASTSSSDTTTTTTTTTNNTTTILRWEIRFFPYRLITTARMRRNILRGLRRQFITFVTFSLIHDDVVLSTTIHHTHTTAAGPLLAPPRPPQHSSRFRVAYHLSHNRTLATLFLPNYLYYSDVICVLTSFLFLPHNFFLYIYEHANKIAAS